MIRVGEHRELTAALLALRSFPSALRRDIYKSTRSLLVPEWRGSLAARASTRLEQRVIADGARADVTARGITLKAAQSRRALRGGGSPVSIGHAVEFGAPWRSATIAATRGGTSYRYKRVINKQLRPRRSAGYVAWPTAMEFAARYSALLVQTTVRRAYLAFEGKSD